jgi:chemotaxis protein methyltransferase CheR
MPIATKLTDVTASQLGRYAKLIYDKVGIVVSPQKVTLLSNRVRRRLRATGIESYEEYYKLLRDCPADDPEWEHFLQEITTHETYLFREQKHWDWLREEFTRELIASHKAGQREATVRVWSAACSTGDEAVTIACCLADGLPKTGWKVEILGTDIGAATVAQAQRLAFGERAVRLVPGHYLKLFFEKAASGNAWTPRAPIRDMLRFETHNLLDPIREPAFDLIVLKNVLIYFDAASKRRVLNNVRHALSPRGFLITGAAEGVGDLLDGMQSKLGWLHCAANTNNSR